MPSLDKAAKSTLELNLVRSRGVGGAARQETALIAEGVEVGRGSLGERTVDFSTYGWFPERLPSEEDEEDAEEE
jgi:methylated-DNA-protein-cysteine methyltransferase related protein